MANDGHVPYRPDRPTWEESRARIEVDYAVADARRTVRQFSRDPVPLDIIETAVKIAGTAPSGAHKQPWYFCVIGDQATKQVVRDRCEAEERDFYTRRAPKEWLDALEPLGTDFVKEHITDAPWLIVVFRRDYDVLADGSRSKNYYMTESVGIAVGFLIQALHRAGLATLTHTPAPMTFLRELCGRPPNEKPFVLIPVGYPSPDCVVPDLRRKPLEELYEQVKIVSRST
ncbi:MAG: nitroreductase family protein [Fimbriimonadaceae bacterium]|nr:nitroreductase family protein [Fimbriimonadaceae bacterium]